MSKLEATFNAIETIALAKAIKDAAAKVARKGLSVGTHEVDFSAKISGTLTVGENEEYIPTVHIPLIATMAFFIRRCGITRAFALESLREAMTEALETEKKGAETIAPEIAKDIEDIKEMLTQVTEMLGQLPKQERQGKVTTKLTVTPLELATA